MKSFTLTAIIMLSFLSFKSKAQDAKGSIYDFKMMSIDGQMIDLSQYKGKYMLIVNTASKCGFTPQYADLEKLHEQYGDQLAILGFPANNFGGQEPGSNSQIEQFCTQNYGVKFQMFEKISVKGDDTAPLYAWLEAKTGDTPTWNFCKYLIGKDGSIIGFFPSKVTPFDPQIVDNIK